MANVTDLASVAAATAAGYTLDSGLCGGGNKYGFQDAFARLSKRVAGESGTSGGWLSGVGESPSTISANGSVTVARTNALAALNANRRHRYAGTPGAASGATVVNMSDGQATVPTVDVT